MVDFTWIHKSLFLVLMLQFTVTADETTNLFVRVGQEVTLPCDKVIDDQVNCNGTTWIFSGSRHTVTVELIKLGQFSENIQTKAGRLRVLPNCSLVIKKVTDGDAGVYQCQQYKPGTQRDPEILVHQSGVRLAVIHLAEHQDAGQVTLSCSVSGDCRHTVKWMFRGKHLRNTDKEVMSSQSACSTAVSFVDGHFSNNTLWMCQVTDADTANIHRFPLRPQSSGGKTDDTKTATTDSTRTGIITEPVTTAAITEASLEHKGLLGRFILVSAGLAGLSVTVVTVNIWTRAKRSEATRDKNTVHNDEDEDEDEDEVTYDNIGESSV